MLFEISKKLGKSSVTHLLLAEEQTTMKSKYIKILMKVRFAKINPPKKSNGSQFTKLNPSKMLKKKMTREN